MSAAGIFSEVYKLKFPFNSRIRYSEVGEDQKLTIPGLINYFQDCSSFQSEGLGVGVNTLKERGRAWVLAYWQIAIQRLPVLGEAVVTETWPNSFKGCFGDRSFRMTDSQGNVLACANSLWIFLDIESGHPSKIDEMVSSAYEETMGDALPLPKESRKIPLPKMAVEQEHFTVMKSHLDTNHHVNNCQYVSMAQEYLPEGFIAEQIRVEYRTQAVLHDEIIPMVYTQGDLCTVGLCAKDQKPYAVLEFRRRLQKAEES